MIELNGKKFALNDDEFLNSLFETGGACVGYYKQNKRSITLMDHKKQKIGVINRHGVLCCATKIEGNKWWYSHATIKQIGEYDSYIQSVNEPKKIIESLLKTAI